MSAPPAPTQGRKPQPAKAGRRDRRELARGTGMLALAGISIAFALVNLREVRVDWIVGSGRAPLIVVIVISLAVGVVLTYCAERLSRRRRG